MSASVADPEFRNALITGASSGLGRGLALRFARRGTTVFASARRTGELEGLRAQAAEEKTLGEIHPWPLDVTDAQAVFAAVAEIERSSGGLDLVIANAGIGAKTDGKSLVWRDVEKILQVNVQGAAATLCAAAPGMVARRRGHLVGVSSLAAFRGMSKSAAYCASKAFLSTFLQSLRTDLKRAGVKVTTLQPGFVHTPMTAGRQGTMPFVLDSGDAVERMARAILRGDAEFSFPWPAALAARLAGLWRS